MKQIHQNYQRLDILVDKLNYRPECPEIADFAVFAAYIASSLKGI